MIRSINNGMYLKEVKKFTLSFSNDKRCYMNENESKP